MEDKKEATASSSSLANELFGSKAPPLSSSSALFDSIFNPPSKAWNYAKYEETMKKYDTTKRDKSQNSKADMSPFYQQEESQPCNLSSSLYYGGQDIYISPRKTKNTPERSTQYYKDGEEERGNWWDGSVYY